LYRIHNEWNPQFFKCRKFESGRHDANDGVTLAVELNCFIDEGWIAARLAVTFAAATLCGSPLPVRLNVAFSDAASCSKTDWSRCQSWKFGTETATSVRPPPGLVSQSRMRRSGSRYGSGSSSTVLMTLK